MNEKVFIDLCDFSIVFEDNKKLKSCILNLDDMYFYFDLASLLIVINNKYVCPFFSLEEMKEFVLDFKEIYEKVLKENEFSEIIESIEEIE
jgi:hypothetical protein